MFKTYHSEAIKLLSVLYDGGSKHPNMIMNWSGNILFIIV